MKKSRIAKFALLGASTAALAATLTTSTYAWYVSNKEAKVSGGTGNTGQASADGSIMLAWTNANDALWMKELDLTDAQGGSTLVGSLLSPVSYSDGFKEIDDATGALKTTASSNIITFDYWVKAGKNGTAQISFTFANTVSGQLPTQLLYADTAGKTAGQNVSVDILDAIGVQQIVGTGDPTYIVPSGYTSKTTSGFAPAAGNNAATYFEDITGIAPAVTAPMGTNTAFTSLSLTADTPVHLQYTIFLDGGDYSCYNACQGQTFSWNISYTFTESAGA